MSTETQTESGPTSAKTDTAKAWALFALSAAGMVVFAGLYFFAPKTTTQVQTVTRTITNTVVNTVTNEVIKEVEKVVEVPKEVEKIVEVPAKIPEGYLWAMDHFTNELFAPFVGPDRVLFHMTNVTVKVVLADAIKGQISEDETKARIQLTLRRNNVPIDPDSRNELAFIVDAFKVNEYQFCYSLSCVLRETQSIWRGGDCRRSLVTLWDKGAAYGTAGSAKISDSVLRQAEKVAELFANDYLTSNPKPQ